MPTTSLSWVNSDVDNKRMTWPELTGLAIALAMDAFAVAIVTGLLLKPPTRRQVFRLAFHFGLFQALMPAVGWLAGTAVHRYFSVFDHWLACALLVLVGGKMVWEALFEVEERRSTSDPTSGWSLLVLSVATSIDALAVGLSLAMIRDTIIIPAIVIGLVAALFTATGMVLGRRVGVLWGRRAEVVGGVILVGIGIKIVWEHLVDS